tara:strand:+ start:1285 stop:1608 length:324 start_codon:yes stop_codon:yes gene_type:complete
MKLMTKEIEKKLIKNKGEKGEMPYLKLFNPCGAATWLISEYDKETGLLYGLCDLGLGFPELGYVSLEEIKAVKGPFGIGIERDMGFRPNKTLAEYTREAKANRSIEA